MTKDKKQSLEKYVQHLKNRLESPIPPKHVGHPNEYRIFLVREIKTVETQLAEARLEGVK